MKKYFLYTCLGVIFFSCSSSHSIFNGKNLDGWQGDSTYWRVENGNLVGEITPSTLLKRNSFIIWRGGEVDDFDLTLQYRITEDGNSGINYRSEELEYMPLAMKGYQGDIDGRNNYTGMNYEERGRTTLAKRGQKVVLPPVTGHDSLYLKNNDWTAATITANIDSVDNSIKPMGSWNDFRIVAKGNRLQHFVNGFLISDVTDNDTLHARKKGLLGVQVHVGPPMKIEFRQIKLKVKS